MDLNDLSRFKTIDVQDMLWHIDGLPDQLKEAWTLGLKSPLPEMGDFTNIVVAGMGGSAIGADLAASFLMDKLSVPFIIHRDYGLPSFSHGMASLVIISSHSGNTEEPISAFAEAVSRGCSVIVICTGGKLMKEAQLAGIPVVQFNHSGQPRTAVGFSFGLLMALLSRMGLIPDLSGEIEDTVQELKKLQVRLTADVPVLQNPAKRLAGQMVDRHVTIFGSNFMAPVARRWKTQLNEVSKAVASFEVLPEADHNTLVGICNPEVLLGHELAIFLMAAADTPRNRLRVDYTREIMMLEGVGTDFFKGRGESQLAQMWTALLFGDYVSYYLAMAYGSDPTPIPPIDALKERLSN